MPKEKEKSAINNPHDISYKRVLTNRRVLLHMLRKYTDFEWVKDVREEDIKFEDKEFVTDYFHTYESDLICRIRRGEQEFIRECFRKGKKMMISGFEQIADALEETEDKIGRIVEIARKYTPEYDEKKILDEVMKTVSE